MSKGVGCALSLRYATSPPPFATNPTNTINTTGTTNTTLPPTQPTRPRGAQYAFNFVITGVTLFVGLAAFEGKQKAEGDR